jgi:tetratricopeptide (TPR) repeat protein
VAHLSKGEVQLAKTSLNRAIELNPKERRAKMILADLALKQRDFDTAETLCQEVLGELPGSYQANSIMGRVHLARRQVEDAKPYFDKMIALQPKNPQGYFQMGAVQRLKKDDAGALASFEKALALNPKRLDVFAQIIGIHSARQKFDIALQKCDEQLAIYKDQARLQAFVLDTKGQLYVRKKMDGAAEKAFRAAIEANAEYARSYHGLARVFLRQGKEDKAIEEYNALLARNPDRAEVHMAIATIYDGQRRHDLAKKHYEEALRVNPQFAPAANNLAYILAEKDQNLTKALELARLAKEKLSDDPGVMDTIGWVYYKKGLYDSAIVEFVDSLAKIPGNATVQYHLGMAYHKKGDREKAKSALEKALALGVGSEKRVEIREVLSGL